MHFTTVVTLLVASIGINAAPSGQLESRLETIPLDIYSADKCKTAQYPRPATTAFIPADGSCFAFAPIFSGNTDSAIIDPAQLKDGLPRGCTLQTFSNSDCNSTQSITFTRTGKCATFGPGVFFFSARAVGTCA